MSFTYRIAGLQDRENYIDFINYVFSYDHRPHDFKVQFPKEYRDGFEGKAVHFLALNELGRIRGVVAVLPFEMQILGHRLSCGFIGSVSVHPYARGEGHMKKLMAMANGWMKEQQLDLAILDGKRQRYQYYGYTKGGLMLRYRVTTDNIRHGLKDIDTAPYRILPVHSGAADTLEMIHKLQSQAPVHVVRELSQVYHILTGGRHRLYAVWHADRFAGYLTASKEGSLSEFLLSDASHYGPVIKLWGNMCQSDSLDIHVSPWDRTLAGILDSFAEDTCLESGGNLQILNWEHTLPAMLALKQMAAGSLADGCCRIPVDGKEIELRMENGSIRCIATPPGPSETGRGSDNGNAPAPIQLQEKIFSTGSLLHPQPICGAPKDWFPIPFSLPLPDHF